MEYLPPLSVDLLKHLEAHYPERCPNPSDTDREIWMKAGERRLLNYLIRLAKNAEEDSPHEAPE